MSTCSLIEPKKDELKFIKRQIDSTPSVHRAKSIACFNSIINELEDSNIEPFRKDESELPKINTTVLNLSPLSLSASSITPSSSNSSTSCLANRTKIRKPIADLVATNLANQVGSITNIANRIEEGCLLDRFFNQYNSNMNDENACSSLGVDLTTLNSKLNCTFESLI